MEVDLEYPGYLHELHRDYPLAPEKKFIKEEMLSLYARNVKDKLKISLPEKGVQKLCATLEKRKNISLTMQH